MSSAMCNKNPPIVRMNSELDVVASIFDIWNWKIYNRGKGGIFT
jgi:hypothetical protein